jgi:ribosomal 50S subunit-recycling heat shock protein
MKSFKANKTCQLNGQIVKAGELVKVTEAVAATLNKKLFDEIVEQEPTPSSKEPAPAEKAAAAKAAKAAEAK